MFEKFAIADVASLSKHFNEERIENTFLGEKSIREVVFRRGESVVVCDSERANCQLIRPEEAPKLVGELYYDIKGGVLHAQVEK